MPIAAPSANTSGRPSPTRADHVLQDMDGKIDAIIDGGPVGIGLESTIVDVTEEMPMVLRPGAITVEMLRETVEGETEAVVETINRLAGEKLAEGRKVGIICTDETKDRYPAGMLESIGARARQETVAHNLYAVLRDFDDRGAEYIFSEGFSEDNLGRAIMNRLNKAAGYHILKV